jgi:hypothetical protein
MSSFAPGFIIMLWLLLRLCCVVLQGLKLSCLAVWGGHTAAVCSASGSDEGQQGHA